MLSGCEGRSYEDPEHSSFALLCLVTLAVVGITMNVWIYVVPAVVWPLAGGSRLFLFIRMKKEPSFMGNHQMMDEEMMKDTSRMMQ